ncbi:hypothetical protein ACFZC5_17680 [Nocardia gamkensis]|uniref:hypothetical protein n=1 Tax=Nocardia gamkensis TaxID=352869 RepID=UPI0036E7B586
MNPSMDRNDLDRTELDARGVLIEILGAVEPSLDTAVVGECIDAAAPNRAIRRELARTLAADPELLTSGRPEGPVSLGRLIRSLRERGAHRVVVPCCSDCGKPNPLSGSVGRLRICTGCEAKRRSARQAPCSGCGRHMVCRYRDRHGGSLCAGCRPKDDHLVLDQLCTLIGKSVTDLEAAVVRAAVTAALKRPHYQRQVTWELEDNPKLLTGAGAQGSAKAITLIETLAAAGSHQVIVPPCPVCGQHIPLRASIDGKRTCERCYGKTRQQNCGRCGRNDKVSGRGSAGEPLCRSCVHRDPRNHETCARCGRRRPVVSHTETGEPLCGRCNSPPVAVCEICGVSKPCHGVVAGRPRCEPCTRRVEPCIGCGKTLQVRARTPGGPMCTACYRKNPESFRQCTGCGVLERLHHHGLCKRCAADRILTEILAATDSDLGRTLQPLHAALVATDPRAILEWLGKRGRRSSNPTGAELLRSLATGRLPLTHEAFDAQSTPRIEHLRALLVYAGILPERDEHLAALNRWTTTTLAAIPNHRDLLVIRAFVTWHSLPRLRRRLGDRHVSASQIAFVRNRITIAIGFLDWLRFRNHTLDTIAQGDIDEWLTTGASTRYQLRTFLRWAVHNHYTGDLEIPHRKTIGHIPALDADHRWVLAHNLLHNNEIGLTYRVAGLLVLLYAQPMIAIIALTMDQVARDADGVLLSLGEIPLELPPPVDELVVRLMDEPHGHSSVGRQQRSRWLFPGAHPGRHISYNRMVTELHRLGIKALPSKAAALLDLCTQLPPAVLSRLLGISVTTADVWSRDGMRAGYANALAQRSKEAPRRPVD